MMLDPQANIIKEVKAANINLGYNKVDSSIKISSTTNQNFYITINVPPESVKSPDDIDVRLGEVYGQIRDYYTEHPDQLEHLGKTTQLALVSATGSAVMSNIVFITTGGGSINI